MNAKLMFSIIVISTLLFACGNNRSKDSMLAKDKIEQEPGTNKILEAKENNKQDQQQIPIGNLQTTIAVPLIKPVSIPVVAHIDWDKKIIKNAQLIFEVKDFKKYNEVVHQTIKKYGGYIAQDEQNISEEKSETILSIKVPVDQFEPMVNELSAAGEKVVVHKITSEDVTNKVVDTKSRLEAKKQVRLKYLEFLKASKNMAEVLTVQSEINSIQEEIEAAAGRIEYLSHESSYSTINLSFYQPTIAFVPVETSPSFFTKIATAFKYGGSWLTELLLLLVSVWPLLLAGCGAFFITKRIKLIRNKPQNL